MYDNKKYRTVPIVRTTGKATFPIWLYFFLLRVAETFFFQIRVASRANSCSDAFSVAFLMNGIPSQRLSLCAFCVAGSKNLK